MRADADAEAPAEPHGACGACHKDEPRAIEPPDREGGHAEEGVALWGEGAPALYLYPVISVADEAPVGGEEADLKVFEGAEEALECGAFDLFSPFSLWSAR